jgi:hypothetical protein
MLEDYGLAEFHEDKVLAPMVDDVLKCRKEHVG